MIYLQFNSIFIKAVFTLGPLEVNPSAFSGKILHLSSWKNQTLTLNTSKTNPYTMVESNYVKSTTTSPSTL